MSNTIRRAGLVFSLAGFAISINTLPTLVPWFSARFSVPVSSFGIVFLLQFATFTLCSIGVGRLHSLRKVPLAPILVVALLFSAICIFFVGLLPSFASLILMMILIGGAGGLVESIGTTLITSNEGLNRMLYTSQFFYVLGALFAPLVVGVLLDRDMPVIQIFRLIALFSLLIGILVWLLVFQPWKWAKKSNVMQSILNKEESKARKITQETKTMPKANDLTEDALPRLSISAFPLLFLTMVSYVMIESAMGNWFAVYMHQALNVTLSMASFTLSLFWIGLGVSRALYMVIIIRNHTRAIMIHMGIMLVSIILMVVWADPEVYKKFLFVIFLFGFGCGPIWPMLIDYCSRIFVRPHFIMYLVGAGSIGALMGPIVTSTLFAWMGIGRMIFLFLLYVLLMLSTAFIAMVVTSRRFP